MLERLGVWPLRALWGLLPLTAGAAFGDALAEADGLHAGAVTAGLWAGWAVTLLALLVPHPITLTLVRIVVPAAVPAVAWAVAGGDGGLLAAAGLGLAAAAAVLVLLPVTADLFVDGASYGSERRFALRPPLALWLGPIPLAWAAVVAGSVTGPLLLADGSGLGGSVAVAVGWPLAALAGRALHGLNRRWLVFVPAGFVVHDLATLHDPVLLPARQVRAMGPVPAGATAGEAAPAPTLGLRLGASLDPPVAVAVRGGAARGSPLAEVRELERLEVAPARPGAVLEEAATRGLPVGPLDWA